MIDRRRTLGLLAAALPAATLSAAAHAQVLPSTQPEAPPAPPPATSPPAASPPAASPPAALPAATPPAAAPPPAAPPAPSRPNPSPAAIDATKAYWLLFDRVIDVASMRELRRQLATLVEAGVQEITLVLHSPGGLVDPMLTTYSFIRALPARIDTHAVGFVQSAATILFLVGQNRSADRTARFLFHPSQVPFAGTMTSGQMQDRQTQFAAVAAVSAEIFRDRTTLDDAEIARFDREEVIYTAARAQQAGIVHTVADLKLPRPGRARILFLD